MAEMKKAKVQANVQTFFRKLNPTSWFRRKSKEEAPALPKIAFTKEERARAEMAAAGSSLSDAKKHFEEMRHSTTLGIAAWHATFDSNADRAQEYADYSLKGYGAALKLLAPDSPLCNEATNKLLESSRLWDKINGYKSAKSSLDRASIVLGHDAGHYPYLSGNAQSSAKAILQMLSESRSLAEILPEFSPNSGFSLDARKEAEKIFHVSRDMPMFESYMRKMLADYCEQVAARGHGSGI